MGAVALRLADVTEAADVPAVELGADRVECAERSIVTRYAFLRPGDIAGTGRSDGGVCFDCTSAGLSVDEAPKLSIENSGPWREM